MEIKNLNEDSLSLNEWVCKIFIKVILLDITKKLGDLQPIIEEGRSHLKRAKKLEVYPFLFN